MKSLKIMLVCSMILFMSIIPTSCNRSKYEFEFEYNEEEKVAYLTSYKGSNKVVMIPEYITKNDIDYKVTRIKHLLPTLVT